MRRDNLRAKTGNGPVQGTATLSAGGATVNTVEVTGTAGTPSQILLSRRTQGTGPGFLSFTITNDTSFAITSSSGTDDADIDWEVVN
jgi:hypothetical protein